MILKMENYKYPTREEWLEISRTFPEMGRFGFSNIKEFTLLLKREKSPREVHQLQNLYHWDTLINNKIWNFRLSYVNTLVNYNRGVPFLDDEFNDEVKVINLSQFEFFFETALYYLISVKDLVLQIINLAFIEKPLKEYEVKWNQKMKGELIDLEIRDIVTRAYTNLKEINDLRNSMAHKFALTSKDYRSSISSDDRTYGSTIKNEISYIERVEKLNSGLESLHLFYIEIRNKLCEKFSLENC